MLTLSEKTRFYSYILSNLKKKLTNKLLKLLAVLAHFKNMSPRSLEIKIGKQFNFLGI